MPKIVPGFTTCPLCTAKRIPQEPYMAVPTDDERVFCYACNHVTSELSYSLVEALAKLPHGIVATVLSLISMPAEEDVPTYKLVSIGSKGLGFSEPMTDADQLRASAAVAQGNADVLLSEAERVDIVFHHGPYAFHTLKLSYLPGDLKVAFAADCPEVIGDREQAFIDRLPQLEGRAVRQLILEGFTPNLDGADISSSLRRVHFVKGSGNRGVTAEISWTV